MVITPANVHNTPWTPIDFWDITQDMYILQITASEDTPEVENRQGLTVFLNSNGMWQGTDQHILASPTAEYHTNSWYLREIADTMPEPDFDSLITVYETEEYRFDDHVLYHYVHKYQKYIPVHNGDSPDLDPYEITGWLPGYRKLSFL